MNSLWLGSMLARSEGGCIKLCLRPFPFPIKTRGWVVDTAGHGSGSSRQGLGCWPTVGLFLGTWPHLR